MQTESKDLLERLHTQGVEFVVIGGICAVLHGSARVTFDLDICAPFSPANLKRIENALKDLNPRHRMAKNKPPLELTHELIERLQNLYLLTDWGILDCLSSVAGIGNFKEALKCSVPRKMTFGEIKMLSIEALIKSKEAIGRPHDLTDAAALRAIQERL